MIYPRANVVVCALSVCACARVCTCFCARACFRDETTSVWAHDDGHVVPRNANAVSGARHTQTTGCIHAADLVTITCLCYNSEISLRLRAYITPVITRCRYRDDNVLMLQLRDAALHFRFITTKSSSMCEYMTILHSRVLTFASRHILGDRPSDGVPAEDDTSDSRGLTGGICTISSCSKAQV